MKQIYPVLTTFALFLVLSLAPAWAEEPFEAPKQDPANKIVKWCKDDGGHIRYTSNNITLPGYHPCGRIEAIVTCDASGKRIIGKNLNRPYDHRDCAVGKRITVVPEEPLLAEEQFNNPVSLSGNFEFREQASPAAIPPNGSKRSIETIPLQNDQLQRLNELQTLAQDLLQDQLSGKPTDSAKREIIEGELDRVLKNLDPHTEKNLRKFIDVGYWEKVFNNK